MDTRVVGPLSDGVSGNFLVDNRALDGVIGFAVSGPSSIDTGGHLMGVPIVRGISPEIVPGIDGRQWVTISGTGFAEGARVVLRTGSEVFTIPAERTQRLGATAIRVFVNVTSQPAEWTVQVTNPGELPSVPLAFQVGGRAVSPAGAVDFGTLAVGATRARAFTLRNTGEQTINWSVALGGMFAFDDPAAGTLDAGASTQLTLLYAPTAPGAHAVTARFSLGGQIHQRHLTGRAETGELVASHTLSGQVTVINPSGIQLPVPHSVVWLSPGNSATRGAARKLQADRDGSFTFDRLAPGPHRLRAFVTLGTTASYQDTVVEVNVGVTPSPITVVLEEKPRFVPTEKIEPVVLVRGIGENDDLEDGYWAAMRSSLSPHFTVWDPNLSRPGVESHVSTLLGEANYDTNAGRLHKFITEKIADLPPHVEVTGIHYLAHSMGGLTTRRLLSRQLADPAQYDDLPKPRRVVMLATPHAGSYLADPSEIDLLRRWRWRGSWQSTQSLRTDIMRSKTNFPWPSEARLYLGAGTSAGLNLKLRAGSAYIFNSAPPGDRDNDGAVSVRSAFGTYLAPRDNAITKVLAITGFYNPFLYEEVRLFQEAGNAIQREFPLNHDTILTDPSARDWVVSCLRGIVSNPYQTFAPAPAPVPMSDEDPVEFAGVPVDQFSFTLDPAQATTAGVPLSGEGKAQWVIGLSDSAVGVRMQRPDAGGWIFEGGPGVDWDRIEDDEGALLMVTLETPEVGMWVIEADGGSLGGTAEVSVAVAEESSLRFEAMVDTLLSAGAAAPMLAAASMGDDPATTLIGSGSVSATVIGPSDEVTSIQLPDNGQQGEGEAGDGLHGLLSEDFTDPGIYHATFRFDGAHPDGGMAVRRIARAGFTRAAPGGFIAEILGHRTVDADDNGYADAVIFDIRIDVTEPGDFSLSGTLVEADGGASFQAVTEFHRAEAGAGVVNLVFNKTGLPMGRESGPFVFRELRLVRAEGDREWLHDYPAADDYAVPVRMFNGHSRHLRVTGDLDAGWVKVGESATRTLRIHNDGWQGMTIAGLALPEGFAGDFGGGIEAGAHEDVEIVFTPVAAGDYGGGFDVFSDANGGATVELQWSGTGYTGILFEDWLAGQNVPADQRGPLDDPNDDGVPNLLAYLYNISAIGSLRPNDRAAIATPYHVEDEHGRYFGIRYRHHRDAERLTVSLQFSPDLSPESWLTVTPDSVIEHPADPDTGDHVRELRVRIEDAPAIFYRLSVSEDP